ncbi:uncharacterized protein I303_106656 [Kwoniella dejecticola CBS 10117]|uniref:2-dehydropantoate 2-reductase n=1 Tax=Kwoniella dejecticola CBS 10117 TaxID=1296121 RepID=A0A1A5ZU52_9TREE|nr:uncharacterized protein I303_08701 [Kwoniella dejecticola CBS 10117]OBR81315.1 hypothetical protein I303_08701 [Kwoniella dejecticola CBS 10117]
MTKAGVRLLGVGSIGTLLAHHLRLSSPSTPLTLLLRSPSSFPSSIKVVRDGKESHSSGYRVETSLSDGSNDNNASKEPVSSLIIATKTTQTLQALEPLIPRLNGNSTIALLQNGMGVYQEVISNFFRDENARPHFILGTTPHGVSPFSKGKGHIHHHVAEGEGFIKWGLVNDEAKAVGDQSVEEWLFRTDGQGVYRDGGLNRLQPGDLDKVEIPKDREDLMNLKHTIRSLINMEGLNSHFIRYDDLNRELLLKLVINACNNPTTAILGRGYMKNGVTLSNEWGRDIVDSIVRESSYILLKHLEASRRSKITNASTNTITSTKTNTDTDADLELFEYDHLKKLVYDTILFNSNNISSMAVDILQERQTEIDYINGYLVKLGNELGCETSVNRLIVDMVKFIEALQMQKAD